MPDLVQIILLALIQGLSEFLPVSSSAHLVLPSLLLGWQDQGLLFDVAIHGGTLLAVLLYFRRDIVSLLLDLVPGLAEPSDSTGEVWRLALATVPVVFAGLLLNDLVETQLRSLLVIATTTIVFGVVLGLAVVWQHRGGQLRDGSVSWWHALLIGLAQAFAIVPGVSRSGVTISAAMLLGYPASVAARFSFLLSIPTILGALVFMLVALLAGEGQTVSSGLLAVAFVVAAGSAYTTIALFLRVLAAVGLMPFVVYRMALGSALLALVLFNG